MDKGRVIEAMETPHKSIKERKQIKALYLCDGEEESCSKNNCYKNGGECMLTRNIRHAKNFEKDDRVKGYETYKEIHSTRKFDVVRRITDVKKFSEMIFDILKDKKTAQEIEEFLKEDFPEDGLQKLESIARNGYPLSLDGIQ